MDNLVTRFRAYQLGTPGSSFSYSVDSNFTLIEARYNDINKKNIKFELDKLGLDRVSCLHITSWDKDHCNLSELKDILKHLKPYRIEYPGYEPHTDNAKECLKLICNFTSNIEGITPDYINNLPAGKEKKYNDILFNPVELSDNSNNNSTVQLFRRGRFSLLSLGDCEDAMIAKRLIASSIIKETDIMILAHHGADNGFTTKELIDVINPKITICSSNYDNQFEHPSQNIRNILYNMEIPLYTTKEGDIIAECGSDNKVKVYNFVSNNTVLKNYSEFDPKLLVE